MDNDSGHRGREVRKVVPRLQVCQQHISVPVGPLEQFLQRRTPQPSQRHET